MAEQNGYKVLHYDFVPPQGNARGLPSVSHLLYFLVDNITFAKLLSDMQTKWLPQLAHSTRSVRVCAKGVS